MTPTIHCTQSATETIGSCGPAWLFCPADRPDRFAKAAAIADVVILDLEDGVGHSNRDSARLALKETPLNPRSTVVRVNPAATSDHDLDIKALSETQYTTVMLAKAETAEQVQAMAPFHVVALIETPKGALNIKDIACVDNTLAMMWGAEDLIVGLGGTHPRNSDGSYRDVARHVRSQSLLAAKAYGRLALDSVYLDITDREGLRAEVDDAVAVGFDAKVAIHPNQIEVIRAAYAPTMDQLRWAHGVLDAARQHSGAFRWHDSMVDVPVIRQAERIIQRSSQGGP